MSEGSDPRPQYGEYATPEQQRQAKGQGADGRHPHHPHEDSRPDQAAVPTPDAAAGSARASARHPVDRVVTFVLLALGLFLVLNGIPGYLALPQVLQGVYDSLGAGHYSEVQLAASLGVAVVIVQGLLWLLTALLSFTAIRRGRLSWWIAVVGGALSFIAVMVIVSIALFSDPGFVDSLQNSRTGRTGF